MTQTAGCPFCGPDSLDYSKIRMSIVVPVYNEETTIEEILHRIKKVDLNTEIIIVDDYSTDSTREILKRITAKQPDIKLFHHNKNMGKGAALRTAFQHVTGDIVIIQDADLEYNPNEYYQLITPIIDGRADVVYGSRFLGGIHRVLYFWHYVANKFLTTLSNIFTDLNLTDMECGYKVFKAEVLKDITLESNRFGFEAEFTAKIAKKKYIIYEIPISYSGRDYSQGKKIGWKDAVNAFYCIIRYNLLD